MLKIKNGKFYGSNYAFALPEGFYLNVIPAAKCGGKRLELANCEGVTIIIFFNNRINPAKKDMQETIDANESLIKIGDFISVKRGEGEGVGLYYRDTMNSCEHYEEFHDFKENMDGETQLDIDIALFTHGRKDRTIQKVLELPAVKAFLESVEYF